MRPPNERAYERILLFGGPGAGKTRSWLDIAKLSQKTGSDARFFAIDTDFAVDRMLMGEDFADLTNVEHAVVDDWTDLMSSLDKYRKEMTPKDWLIVDMLGYAWEAVQAYYTQQVFGEDLGSFFLAARKADKEREFEGWTDWKVINKLYAQLTTKLMRTQGHVLCTAAIDKVGERDDEAVRKMFGRFGVKPRGQKHTGHLFHTLLISQQAGPESWVLTSVKDRERRLLEAEPNKGFALSYLVRVAGWRP